MDAELQRIESELINCIKCGFCRSVCPVFASLEIESTVARGKMGLIEAIANGDATVTKGFAEKMSLCLMCKACVANCPSKVKVDRAVMAARALCARKKGLSPVKKLIFRGVLKPKYIMGLGLGVGSVFQGLFIKKSKRAGSYKLRIPVVLAPNRVIPCLAKVTLRNRPVVKQRVEAPRGKVAFFTGCLQNYVYADMGEAIVQSLQKLGVHVVVPKEQQCCGLPALVNGDTVTAAELAAAGATLFSDTLSREGLDAIVVACASCGSCLKHEWEETLRSAGPRFASAAQTAARLSEKVYDVSEYLVDIIKIHEMDLSLKPIHKRVTYHDPCHLNRGQGVSSQPRKILGMIPGLELVEMANPGRCCGGAGSFSLVHYDLSMDINSTKADDIAQTQAEMVITGCPGCTMHISDGLHKKNMTQPIAHTLQLLNESLSNE